MTITKTSYIERVLIVLNKDGTLKGAHSQTLDTIMEDGVVLRQSQGDATPVDAASLSNVLPDQAALMAQIEVLKVERDAALADKQTAETAAQAAADQHASEIASLKSAHDAEKATLKSAHDAEKASLQAQIDALKPPTDANGVPQEVSMYQARAALIGAGLYEQVNAAVSASADEIVKVAWEYATVVKRSSPFITAMSGALGLDDATIDQLFVSAAQIV